MYQAYTCVYIYMCVYAQPLREAGDTRERTFFDLPSGGVDSVSMLGRDMCCIPPCEGWRGVLPMMSTCLFYFSFIRSARVSYLRLQGQYPRCQLDIELRAAFSMWVPLSPPLHRPLS